MREETGDGLLALFPGFEVPGGVQISGRLAWEKIAERGSSGHRETYLFCYGGTGETWAGTNPNTAVSATSRSRAVVEALRRRWPVRLLLVWHLDLLKLIPFLRVSGARIVLFLHGIEAWKPQDWLTGTLLERVGLFLTNSKHTWERFLSFHPRFAKTPHATVALGLDEPLERPSPRPGDPPSVLMISRLLRTEDYKGHREMIAAWPLVLQRQPEAELWIAGDGDLREDLEQIARARGLGQRVRFWGAVSEEEKQRLLLGCDCFAMPSRGEGFGLAYVEAMRNARPCLVSTVDAGREVINPPEAGLAVDPGDPEQISEAVCRLLTHGPEWEQWSLQARRRYANHFTAQQFQQRLMAAL